MLKYILNEDALMILTGQGVYQWPSSNPLFDTIVNRIKNGATLEDVLSLERIFYEDDELSLLQERENPDNIEVFYNGRYFELHVALAGILTILHRKNGERGQELIEKSIPFLKALFDAPVDYEKIVDVLEKGHYGFLPDGSLLILKKKEEASAGVKYFLDFDLKDAIGIDEYVINTVIKVDLKDLNQDMIFEGYEVVTDCIGPVKCFKEGLVENIDVIKDSKYLD